jgi:hypothetical protein
MRSLAAALAFAVLASLTGCGSAEQTAAEQVPGLSTRLDAVDAAVAAHRYRTARDRIADLVQDTVAARDAGDLDAATADRILASAARLLTSLPAVTPSPTPSATATTSAAEPKKAPERPKADKPKKKPGKGKGHGKGR